MEEFPSNSHKQTQKASAPEEERRVGKVISGTAKTRKKPVGRKFKDTFIVGSFASVRSYVLDDVFVPRMKETIADMGIGIIEQTFFGGGRSSASRGRGAGSGSGSYTPYGRYSGNSSPREEPRREMTRRGRSQHDFDEIIIPSRAEAQDVLEKLYEQLSRYKEVKVSDLYDACDITWQYTDNRWGWTSLEGSGVQRVSSGGYILNLPAPQPLK